MPSVSEDRQASPLEVASTVPIATVKTGVRRGASVTTLEEMKGYFVVGDRDHVTDEDYVRAERQGRRDNTHVVMHLRLTADDIKAHLEDPMHPMRIEGWIRADTVWGKGNITRGTFGLWSPTKNPALKRMEYCFEFDGGKEGPLTLIGFKEVSEYLYTNVMEDSQTLFCRIYRGSVGWAEADTAPVYAVGILHLHWRDFVKYDIFGLRFGGRGAIVWGLRFLRFFLGTNWKFQRLKKTGRLD
jgi:hypothetical protein